MRRLNNVMVCVLLANCLREWVYYDGTIKRALILGPEWFFKTLFIYYTLWPRGNEFCPSSFKLGTKHSFLSRIGQVYWIKKPKLFTPFPKGGGGSPQILIFGAPRSTSLTLAFCLGPTKNPPSHPFEERVNSFHLV